MTWSKSSASKAETVFATLEKVESTRLLEESDTPSWLLRLFSLIQRRRNHPVANFEPIPIYEPPPTDHQAKSTGKTVLYLAYGSNLAASTFRGNRGIKPLSAVNVVVPDLELVFDLSGLAYTEPCFANSRFRSEKALSTKLLDTVPASERDALRVGSIPVETEWNTTMQGWKKGMVGVVYEVTEEDYAHIIATEGGDSSYADIEISCYPLSKDEGIVPVDPQGPSFKAHTLFAKGGTNGRTKRQEGYAQPSKRYLSLITTGSREHALPAEYRDWLATLKPYRITSWRQNVGMSLFLATWIPWILLAMGLMRANSDKWGRAPAWCKWLTQTVFDATWASHDYLFRPLWGDGERTVEK